VLGQLLVGAVQVGIVEAGGGDAGRDIVGDDESRHPTQEFEAAPVRADPVRKPLAPGGLHVGEITRPQHGDKDLGLPHLPGAPVHHRHRLAGVVYEKPFAGHIVLAQHRLQGALPAPVELAELAILIAVGVSRPVLLPEQPQGHTFAAQLLVDRRPLRPGTLTRRVRRRWEEQRLQRFLVHPLRQRPAQPRGLCPQQAVSHRRLALAATHRNRPVREPRLPAQP